MLEPFELSLCGGPAERRYRRASFDIEALPWHELHPDPQAAAEWAEAALQEYASAAELSLTLRALLRARVPMDLCAVLAQFPLHEIAHAELCARVAAGLGGAVPLYRREQLFPAPADGDDPLLDAALRVVTEMCVMESWSHGMLKGYLAHARLPVLAAVWQKILDDEAAHAGFGWLFLDWLMPELDDPQRRRLTEAAQRTIRRIEESLAGAQGPSPLGIIGSTGQKEYLACARRSLESRVRKPLARFGLR